MIKFTLHLKSRITVLLCDSLMVPAAWFGAYWLRFNMGDIPHLFLMQAAYTFVIVLCCQVVAFWLFGLYRGIWKFASLPDLFRIIKAVAVGAAALFLLFFVFRINIPRSILPLYAWLLVSFLGGARSIMRWLKDYRGIFIGERVLIVGAGDAGELLLRHLTKKGEHSNFHPVILVDDDKERQGLEIHGVRVGGLLHDIPRLVKKYNIALVIIAIPSAKAAVMRNVVSLCEEAEVTFRTIPELNDIVSGRVGVQALRDVSLEDLLGRDPVTLDWDCISEELSGKRVLVSGGGGSIGSELCRQIAKLAPQQLIVIDNSEFNLYSLEQELRQHFPYLDFCTKLIDVVDKIAVDQIMQEYQPQAVFHAAAYKHVPLLESQLRVAMQNNILGTYYVAQAAANNEVGTFVLISTDKAVNPCNIMGATKRAAEVICQNFNGKNSTRFITVRFGNVLGSAGSVVPLFKSQLERGDDLTVTHPEISRYFMTIPEAAQLILQASVMGQGGEIFVLDMGEPIKIKFLAEQMIHLSGKKLGEDVNIVYVGLRPGEKLHEELFHDSEELIATKHQKILQAKYRRVDWSKLVKITSKIQDACRELDNVALQQLLSSLVPEYQQNKITTKGE